jgi:hypothetical protein
VSPSHQRTSALRDGLFVSGSKTNIMANPITASLAFYHFRLSNASAVWAILFAIFSSIPAFSQDVYITRTGEKYHRDGCRYLSKSKIECSLNDAVEAGLTPCSVCKPSSTSTQEPVKTKTPSSNTSSQCSAKTQSGKRCSRMTKETNGRCWQHQ